VKHERRGADPREADPRVGSPRWKNPRVGLEPANHASVDATLPSDSIVSRIKGTKCFYVKSENNIRLFRFKLTLNNSYSEVIISWLPVADV